MFCSNPIQAEEIADIINALIATRIIIYVLDSNYRKTKNTNQKFSQIRLIGELYF